MSKTRRAVTQVFKSALTAACLLTATTFGASANVQVHTADLPPFAVPDNADMPGITVEMLREAAARADVDLDILYSPWKRAQNTVHTTPQTIVLPPARTATREEKFDWIAKLLEIQFMFFTNGEVINSFEEAQSLGKIVVLRDSAMMHILKSKGFTNLMPVNDLRQVPKMLASGRADAWFEVGHMAQSVLKGAGLPKDTLAQGDTVLATDLWIASNHEFDDAVGARLAAAVEQIIADGTRDAIVAKYVD